MQIYEPAEDSYLLQKFVRKYAKGRVLDMGTGSGIQALTAIKNSKVKEVVAVDINSKAVKGLKKEIKRKEIKDKKLKKIKVIKSDLFQNVTGEFNLIIFNPPYLPQDKIGGKNIEDSALYGGKKGWEISERFLNEVSEFLNPDGKILFLFSSLTNKKKIDGIIINNLLQFKQLATEKLPMFEDLFVYGIIKSPLLRLLEKKGIKNIHYFSRGRRGLIYKGVLKGIDVAIKVKKKESKAINRIKNEAKWLKILNKKGIGPKLLFSGKDYLITEFIDGEFVLNWIKKNSKNKIKTFLKNILGQCFVLDKLKINKEEMHHPLKHIIVNKKPALIDFERTNKTKKPKNVTQFVEFICRMKKELEKKDFKINVGELRVLAREYKKNISKKKLECIKLVLV